MAMTESAPDTMHGHVTNVSREVYGDQLAIAATTSDLVLTVIDTADFDEDGGTVRLDDGTNSGAGTLREYTSITDDPPTITLTAGPAVALDAGTRVDVWDTDADDAVVEYVADVVDDITGDLVQATVEHTLVSLLHAVVRAGVAESVVCRGDRDGRWNVMEVLGRVPVIDGTTYQTAESGERVVIRNDGDGGVIEFFTGEEDETPGVINPSTFNGRPGITLEAGGTPTHILKPRVELYSGSVPEARIVADEIYLDGFVNAQTGTVGTGSFRDSVDERVEARCKVGEFVGSTNASAQVTITHGLGSTPVSLGLIGSEAHGAARHRFTYDNLTATTFRVTVRDNVGGLVSSPTRFMWQAWR